MRIAFLFSCVVLFQGCLFLSSSIAEVQRDPSSVVRTSVDRVLTEITTHKKTNGESVTEQMVQSLIGILDPVVDFQSFSRSVMGKHAKEASAQQKEEFARIFTESLVKYYTESLITFEIKEVVVFEQKPDFDPDSGRATVQVQATDGDGKNYEVRYTMRTNSKGEWKVRNFLIEGINVGLTFLNQFDGAMARHNNNIDTVIARWSEEIVQNSKQQQT